MRWFRIGVVALLVALVALLVFGLRWLLYTESGLQYVLAQLEQLPTVKIQFEGTKGPIAGPLSVERLVVDHEAVRIEAEGLRIEPRFRKLVLSDVTLSDVRIARLRVELKESRKEPEGPVYFLPRFLGIVVRDFAAEDVTLRLVNGQELHFALVSGSAKLTRWRIELPSFAVEDPAGRIDGSLTLRAARPLGLRGSVAGHWRLPDEHDYHFRLAARGTLDELGTDLALTQPAKITFSGTALTLAANPRISGTIRVTDFDLSPWVPAGTLPRMSGSIATVATRSTIGLGATLTAPEFGDGPLRLRGGAEFRDRTISIRRFRAWLPRSTMRADVEGTIELLPEQPRLALELQWQDLRWPVVGETVVESPTGSGRIEGTMPLQYDLAAETRGPAIPAASWRGRGSIDRSTLVVDAFDGTLLKGRLSASGRLSWKEAAPWALQVDGKALDLSELRPAWPSRIDVKGSIDGRGLSVEAPWTARIASVSGTLRGRRLTGRGEIRHEAGVYDIRQLRVSNGDSRVDVNGRFGKSMDLRWDASLASLSLVDPALRGSLVTTGHATGTTSRPHVTGTANLRDLQMASLHFDAVDADVDFDATDRSDSSVEVVATDGGVGTLDIDRVALRGAGRMSGHTLEVNLVSPGSADGRLVGFRGNAAAEGSYAESGQAWRGTLQRVSLLFPDNRVRLLQPTEVSLSPRFAQVAPLCLAAEEARLCAEGEWNSRPQSWRVIYSAQDWPLQRILVSLLGRRDFDGKLQASGWASQEAGKPWIGATTLVLDAPTVDIPRNKFRTERIQLGNGRLDLFAEADEIRATLDTQLTEGTRIDGNLSITRLAGGDWQSFPLRGRLEGRSTILAAIPLFVPEIDRSDGEMSGTVTAGGTLGEPRFDGELRVRNGRFELYRTNLVLSDTTLDAKFQGDELEISGRGRTAKGAVTLDGRFTWPEGVMTGSMRMKGEDLLVADTPYFKVLASPDLEFRAMEGRFEVDGSVLIPQARITPKQLTTSVSTSPDERVVGIDSEDPEPSTVQRVSSRVRVILGDNVTVDTYGLKARLGGELTVTTRPGDVSRGNGSINVIEGEYSAFGTNVKITKGRLSFADAPLGSPTIDLVAERRIEDADVTVAINVRGPISRPFIDLTSTPAMSSNEALSYLIAGKSIDTLQSGEAASIDRAAETLAISGGGLLLGGLGERLGFDSVSVEKTGEDDTSVVLGKFLSPKLFVSYGISIAEAINTIKLRYTLDGNWSLKAEAGLTQSADVEYRIER